jgi:hypothetical protein
MAISPSVTIIAPHDFSASTLLDDAVFVLDCPVKKIDGFSRCASLCRIDIPSSVEVISKEAIVASNSRLEQMLRFRGGTSLFRIEIPSSVELISDNAFSGYISLHAVIFASNIVLTTIGGFGQCMSLDCIEIH